MPLTLVPTDCPTCKRSFALHPEDEALRRRCPTHCSPRCCRAAHHPKCKFVPAPRPYFPRGGIKHPKTSKSPVRPTRCRVCHTPLAYFEPFPSGSILLDHYPDPSYPPLQVYQHPNSGLFYLLNAVRPRIHIDYCSLRCYCDPTAGHYHRARGGKLVRQHRYNAKHGHMPREIRRWWREEKARNAEHEQILARWAEEEARLESDLLLGPPANQ